MNLRSARVTQLERRWRQLHPPELAHHLPIALQLWDEPNRDRWRGNSPVPVASSAALTSA